MTKFDSIYTDIVIDIINNGQMQKGNVRAVYADGTPAYTKYVYGVHFEIKPEDGLPILQSKHVGWKTALKELDWIWRQMSNSVDELNDMGVRIWDEWRLKDGTIGKSYGYQLKNKKRKVMTSTIWPYRDGQVITNDIREEELNQVEFVLHEIYNNPRSRRIMTSLFDVDDLGDMALEPCVWSTNWSVDEEGKLHLFVKQRSGDIMLGVPYNALQYSVLHRRIAQVTGKELGSMHWTIDNAHIYDRHLELAEEQVTADISHLEELKPELILPDSLQFFRTPLHEAKIINYKHNGSYKYEVAI